MKLFFIKSIKVKISLTAFFLSIIPILITGFVSYQIAKHSMSKAGLGQIKDTLQGGFSLIEQMHKKNKMGLITKKEALKEIKNRLNGPVKEMWVKLKNEKELQEFLESFNIKKPSQFKYTHSALFYKNDKIAFYVKEKELFIFTHSFFLEHIINRYSEMGVDEQRRLINNHFQVRIIRDFTKATVKIRNSGYVWAITANLDSKSSVYEVFHPFIEGFNLERSRNFKGELVGKNISTLNGKFKKNTPNQIVKYEYLWKNPTDKCARRKVILMKYFKPWNWVVSSGFYEDEFYHNLEEIKKYIFFGILLFGLISFFFTFKINSHLLEKPIKSILTSMKELKNGNLEIQANVKAKDEIGELADNFNIMSRVLKDSFQKIENYNLTLEKMVEERTQQLKKSHLKLEEHNKILENQMEMAERVQQSILPSELDYPKRKELRMSSQYIAMEKLGGDLFDIIMLNDHQYAFLMSDVSGHGVPAALITTMAKVLFHEHAKKNVNAGETCKLVNQQIYKLIGDLEYYLTAFFCTLNIKTGVLNYASAGHHPGILLRNKEVISIKSKGTFIGIFDHSKYETKEIELKKGDRLILYTDGIIEARNNKKHFYGYSRFIKLIKDNQKNSPKDFVSSLFDDLKDFGNGRPADDDRAILCIDFIEKMNPKISS